MIDIGIILIIGYGSMGRRRIRLVHELIPNASFICFDSLIERQMQARKDGHTVVASIEKGLEFAPDIAFVCTSPGHHADVILPLLKAGIHVFTELNLTTDKYGEMTTVARENNVLLFISSTLIYKKQMRMCSKAVSRQEKPVAYQYHVGQYLSDWHPWENYKDFFVAKKETNGVREIMAIQLPWIIQTFGPIEEYHVLNQNCTGLDIDFPDTVILNLRHKSGHIGTFLVDITSRRAITHLEIIGDNIHILWDGHNDDLYQLNLDTKEFEQVVVYDTEEHIEGYSNNIAEEPYRDEIRAFLGVIDGDVPVYGLKDDRYVLELIDKIEDKYEFRVL